MSASSSWSYRSAGKKASAGVRSSVYWPGTCHQSQQKRSTLVLSGSPSLQAGGDNADGQQVLVIGSEKPEKPGSKKPAAVPAGFVATCQCHCPFPAITLSHRVSKCFRSCGTRSGLKSGTAMLCTASGSSRKSSSESEPAAASAACGAAAAAACGAAAPPGAAASAAAATEILGCWRVYVGEMKCRCCWCRPLQVGAAGCSAACMVWRAETAKRSA